jgi:hypothetical protein
VVPPPWCTTAAVRGKNQSCGHLVEEEHALGQIIKTPTPVGRRWHHLDHDLTRTDREPYAARDE